MPFARLWAGLRAARAAGMVTAAPDAATGRSLWCYTSRGVYESGWDDCSLLAQRHAYASFAGLLADAEALPATREGFVNGLWLKVKGPSTAASTPS